MRHFGVPNHKPLQIELLKTAVEQPLLANQLQFSLAVANMVANGLEVNNVPAPRRSGSTGQTS